MSKNLILVVSVLWFALGACAAPQTSEQVEILPTEQAVEQDVLTELPKEPAEEEIQEPAEPPTPYPVPEKPTHVPTINPYPDTAADALPAPTLAPTIDPYPGPDAGEWPLVFTDDLGNTIELPAYPQSIVSLSPSMTEILFAIGAGDQLVGRDDFSLYPEEALSVESVGGLYDGVPTETILALEPDLVLVAQIISEETVQVLLDLGLPVFWQANPADFDGLYANLLEIAALTGHTEETEQLVSELQTRVAVVEEIIANAKDAPTVFYELDATEPSNPWTTGAGTFIDYIISKSGGMNVAAELQGDYIQISSEELIAANPEIILLADALYGVTPEIVAERPGWDVIIAIQNGALYPIDPNMMSVPGPRLVDALEETARLVHPELFE